MGYSFDNSKVTFAELKESEVYSRELIEAIESEQFEYLKRNDVKAMLQSKEFVEPLLYACINSKRKELFQIYAHLEDGVQIQLLTDINVSSNILINAPEVITGTPLAEDKKAILANVDSNPEIIEHISDKLGEDRQFVAELSKKGPKVLEETIEKYSSEKVAIANPEIVTNPVFIAEKIANDITAIENLDKETLNNYGVFKQAASKNKDVIAYALENSDKLEAEAMRGVRDAIIEEEIKEIKAEAEKEPGNKKLSQICDFIEENEVFRTRTILNKRINLKILTEEELKDSLNLVESDRECLEKKIKNSDYVVTEQDEQRLGKPEDLTTILNKIVDISDEKYNGYVERINKYKKFYSRIRNLTKTKGQKQKPSAEIGDDKKSAIPNAEHSADISDAPEYIANICIAATPVVPEIPTGIRTEGQPAINKYDVPLTKEQYEELDVEIKGKEKENVSQGKGNGRNIRALRETAKDPMQH